MLRQSGLPQCVLVIDSDRAHRQLIATVLVRAGFQVNAVEDATAATDLLQQFAYCAVVRELNLAQAHRDRSMQQLLSTAPEILRRTVITTTTAARTMKMIGPDRVFAVVSKPFEIHELVNVVSRCAGESVSPDGADGEARVKLDTVRRFVREVPTLRRLLGAPVGSVREAALRTEMRRTIGALSVVLDRAARIEASDSRAFDTSDGLREL